MSEPGPLERSVIVDRRRGRHRLVGALVLASLSSSVVTTAIYLAYDRESEPIVESGKLVAECQRRGLVAERLYGQTEIFLP